MSTKEPLNSNLNASNSDKLIEYQTDTEIIDKTIAEMSTTETIDTNIDKIINLNQLDIIGTDDDDDSNDTVAEVLKEFFKTTNTEINNKPIAEEPIDMDIENNTEDNNQENVSQSNDAVIKSLTLSNQLDKLENHNQITLLLLGETGVGKSTFINAFVNYLLFGKMDDAIEKPICLIPAKFTLTDWQTGVRKVCTFGTPSDTENTDNVSESATQYPRCYTFDFGTYRLNIIDTPGMADTNGLDKDNRNMQNILNFISNYDTINGIFVLLKPNESRVTELFKYCIYELLSHLNKSAADNIMFVFTNARSTFYAPGDTTVSLEAVLEQIRQHPPYVRIKFDKSNTFCFDNESLFSGRQ